jgi:hypothetical protein
LPPNVSGAIYLPKVGEAAVMNDEERHESVRRFLNEWKGLLGVEPAQLSLVSDSASADGSRIVTYQQRPFTYPLRGDYGKVEIKFTIDRRLLSVSSTAIPDTAKLQPAITAAAAALREQDINAKLNGLAVTYTDAAGTHTFTISPPVQATPQQLVVYPRVSSKTPGTLELLLVWEITLTNAPVSTLYLDTLQDEVIATRP